MEAYQAHFDLFMSMFPKSWTMGEALSLCRSSLSMLLMVTILVLDTTIDRPGSNDDPCLRLDKTISRQEAMIETLKKLKLQAKKIERPHERDSFLVQNISEVQKELKALAKEDLMDCVGDVMDEVESKQENTSVFKKIFGIVMSCMLLLQVINYMTTGSKRRPKVSK